MHGRMHAPEKVAGHQMEALVEGNRPVQQPARPEHAYQHTDGLMRLIDVFKHLPARTLRARSHCGLARRGNVAPRRCRWALLENDSTFVLLAHLVAHDCVKLRLRARDRLYEVANNHMSPPVDAPSLSPALELEGPPTGAAGHVHLLDIFCVVPPKARGVLRRAHALRLQPAVNCESREHRRPRVTP